MNLLAVLDQNPGVPWGDLVGGVEVDADVDPEGPPISLDGGGGAAASSGTARPRADANGVEEDDDLATFKL